MRAHLCSAVSASLAFLAALPFSVPASAQSVPTWYLLNAEFPSPDPAVAYGLVKTPKRADGTAEVILSKYYGKSNKRNGLDSHDNTNFTFLIDCKNGTYAARHATFADKRRFVIRQSLNEAAIKINPSSELGFISDIACKGPQGKPGVPGDQVTDEGERQAAHLDSLRLSWNGGLWFNVAQSGIAPNRMILLANQISTVTQAQTNRVISMMWVVENPASKAGSEKGIEEFLQVWTVDCVSMQAVAGVQLGLDAAEDMTVWNSQVTKIGGMPKEVFETICKDSYPQANLVLGTGREVRKTLFGK